MENTKFGTLVKILRRERRYINHKNQNRALSREELAKLIKDNGGSELTASQIRHIEEGNVVLLKPEAHVEPLANGLELSDAAKVGFYAEAGFVYEEGNIEPNRDQIEYFLTQLDYPVAVFSPLGDIIAFNTYYAEIYGYTGDTMAFLRQGKIGANILRVYFEPEFRPKEVFCGEVKWRQQAEWSVRAFRVLSLRHRVRERNRYSEILKYMMSLKNSEFKIIWEISIDYERQDTDLLVDPVVSLKHSTFGEISFMKLSIPQPYLGYNLIIFGHFPTHHSQNAYQRFHKTIQRNEVHWFVNF